MELTITLAVGLIAGLLMFCGDMLLYYDKKDYISDGMFNSVIEIMKNVSEKRLYAGGLIGPIAAFLYCVGYYHIVLISNNEISVLAMIAFLSSCMGIIIGGAYHSHCAYLGLIGLLILLICIICGWTMLPNCFAVITPGILYLLLPLIKNCQKEYILLYAVDGAI